MRRKLVPVVTATVLSSLAMAANPAQAAETATATATADTTYTQVVQDGDNAVNGEIDVVELPGGAAYYRAATAAVFYSYTPQVKSDHRYTFPNGSYPGDGFHTYTTEWEPDEIRWYVDGVLIWQRDPADLPWFDEVFHKPYHLRLNFQVGGWLGEPTSATTFPADFQVDYVRVYQR